MPLGGSTAYNTVGQINTLIRSILNDVPANWATDAVLLPYINTAYRTLQRKIANNGGGGFITDDVLLVLPLVPAVQQGAGTQAVINDATPAPNQLPSNLLLPLKLWERPNLSQQDFTEMEDLTGKGGLPSRPQGLTLGVWEWRTDGLYFIGAQQDTQLRLRYKSAFQDLVGSADVVLIRGAQEAIAYAAAGMAGLARGSPLAKDMETLGSDAQEDVIIMNVLQAQNSPARRRAYGSRLGLRRGGRPFDVP
jgi:hypothetical protein